MNIYELIKELDLKEVLTDYGFDIKSNGYMCCPFHDDKTPSLKIYDNNFHCFGCGENGDTIDFISKAFDIDHKTAVNEIAKTYNLPISYDAVDYNSVIKKKEQKEQKKSEEATIQNYIIILSAYCKMFEIKDTDDIEKSELGDLVSKIDYADYLLDKIRKTPKKDRAALIEEMEKDVLYYKNCIEQANIKIVDTIEEDEKKPDSDEKIELSEEKEIPEWVVGNKINEVKFCIEYVGNHPIKNISGMLYDFNGAINEAKIKDEIYEMISPYIISDVDVKINKIYAALKYAAKTEDFLIKTNQISFKNGTYFPETGVFENKIDICLNRLNVNYNPDAEEPSTWLRFVNELLRSEDIPTLQEYMGYCLIPTTKAQKMFLMVGKGGEGKSRVGRVLRAILGDNMNTGSVQKLATDRFARADLEGKLLMLDDDMQMEALKDTNILKTIITIEDKMDLERKGKQSTQGYIYSRIMGFSNGTLQSLFDKSEGFYRRQIIVTTKDRSPDRIDDPNLGEKLIAEAEGIVLWCLEGLERLIKNNYQFTISNEALINLSEAKKDDNNLIDFLESDGYIYFDPTQRSTSKSIYEKYLEWCSDNLKKPFVEKTFITNLKSMSEKYGLTYLTKIKTLNDKYACGFMGIYPKI